MTLATPGRLTPSDKRRIVEDLRALNSFESNLIVKQDREAIIAKLSIGIQKKKGDIL